MRPLLVFLALLATLFGPPRSPVPVPISIISSNVLSIASAALLTVMLSLTSSLSSVIPYAAPIPDSELNLGWWGGFSSTQGRCPTLTAERLLVEVQLGRCCKRTLCSDIVRDLWHIGKRSPMFESCNHHWCNSDVFWMKLRPKFQETTFRRPFYVCRSHKCMLESKSRHASPAKLWQEVLSKHSSWPVFLNPLGMSLVPMLLRYRQ